MIFITSFDLLTEIPTRQVGTLVQCTHVWCIGYGQPTVRYACVHYT